jgi:hypothetical protein
MFVLRGDDFLEYNRRAKTQVHHEAIMSVAPSSLREDYWNTFELQEEDIEFLYNHLLELETPQTPPELTEALVKERIRREKHNIEQQRSSGGSVYLPKEQVPVGQKLVFPALEWRKGEVVEVRPGFNPDLGPFNVIRVAFEGGEEKEFASGLTAHPLNNPPDIVQEDEAFDQKVVLKTYGEQLTEKLEIDLRSNPGFIRVAGRLFPRALLMDVNAGHLNLAEAVLDMAGGGPMCTTDLLKQIDLSTQVNPKLVEFSLDLALEEDPRFDEVGSSGEVLWFLNRLEPEGVRQVPQWLRYSGMDYDRSLLTGPMLVLERELDDELSPAEGKSPHLNDVQIRLIYSHWRAGTLPMSARTRHLFPTAFEAPRIRFMLVDGDTKQKFPAWVVRENRYVFGLREWYETKGLMPGSLVRVSRGDQPGEVVVQADSRRATRDWLRTVLVGSDGGTVFAVLKQSIASAVDERMAIVIPDVDALDQVWQQIQKERVPFERTVVNTVRELAKLNPQNHVHASERYAALNVVRRCPPGPIFALLASRPWFVHVGDLHFRFDDSEQA